MLRSFDLDKRVPTYDHIYWEQGGDVELVFTIALNGNEGYTLEVFPRRDSLYSTLYSESE